MPRVAPLVSERGLHCPSRKASYGAQRKPSERIGPTVSKECTLERTNKLGLLECSQAARRVAVNHCIVGSNPTTPAQVLLGCLVTKIVLQYKYEQGL